ncbi:bacterio-opsin activator [Sulfolobus acidocaldarius SUSAZ]|nr:bacterio-opsin activator [Sulfolobus acidocaldarius SUSAZ]
MATFTKYPLKFLRLSLIHENCWSRYYEVPEIANILNLTPYPERNILKVSLLMSEKGYRDIMNLKSRGKVKDIFNIYKWRNRFYVDLVRDYDNSIYSIINRNNGILISTLKYDGKEIWNLLVYEYKVNRLIKEFQEFAEIVKVNIEDDIPTENLTNRELKVLTTALDLGYFDYPRKIKSKELSEILGISEPTFVFHLRNAERKIVNNYIKKLGKNMLS